MLGDFDSVEEIPQHSNVIKFPAEKDFTDTFLAYKIGLEKGYKNFVIYGGIGGRIDHTIANICTLSDAAKNNARAFLIGDGVILTSIQNSKLHFSPNYKGYVSIFANGEIAKGINIEGLKYSVKDLSLSHECSSGVSNEFIGERAEISVTNGNLLVVWYETPKSFVENIDNFIIN